MQAGPSSLSLRQRLATLAALDEATRAIAGVLDLEEVLQLIVDRVRDLVATRYAALGIVHGDGVIERFITSGLSPAERMRIGALPRGHGLLGVIIREGRSIRVPDISLDPRRYGFPPDHPDMRVFLGVPVMIKGQSVGNLYLTDPVDGRLFTDDDMEVVELFARHAAIAIENARLHEEVQRLAIVDERSRIGRDLHDGIIQSIYAVGLSLEDVPDIMATEPDEARSRIERATEALDSVIRDIRLYILGLRPELLEGLGLAGGVAALAHALRVNTLIEVDHDFPDQPGPEPTPEETAQLLAIVREALNNVARHARATRVRVDLATGPEGIRLVVLDNGVGFDPPTASDPDHQGLVNMRNRAESIGAELVIESVPDAGTRIIVTLPATGRGRDGEGDEGA